MPVTALRATSPLPVQVVGRSMVVRTTTSINRGPVKLPERLGQARYGPRGVQAAGVGQHPDRYPGHAVRLRVTGLKPSERGSVSGFGEVDDDGEWITLRGLEPDHVPELVAELVRMGGRVYSVEPRHQTLEDRFLQLLGTK